MALTVGVVGCGTISGIYCTNGARFQNLKLLACSDIVHAKAQDVAREYGLAALSVDELLHAPEIEAILNLTVPLAHAEISHRALENGKHVYSEKPFATTREEGKRLLDAARSRGLSVGSAPDTFLGAGLQTCRRLIDQGAIGRPVFATAFMTCHGHEEWHPNPEFYYQPGGGPMLDMGPYYLTALVHLLGPLKRVAGMASAAFGQRAIGSGERAGTSFPVSVPTHVVGVMDFESGATATAVTSFDIWASNLPRLEVHGTEGSLSVPDPNTFGGPVRLFQPGKGWIDEILTHGYAENSRGLGLADMADAIHSGRPVRPSGELALHVLDAMQCFEESGTSGAYSSIQCKAAQPEPLHPEEAKAWLRA